MGWGYGTNAQGREVGYSVDAVCDRPGCDTEIDRGLGYVCGGMHDGGEHGCGGYFCSDHLSLAGLDHPDSMSPPADFLCKECRAKWEAEHPLTPGPDDVPWAKVSAYIVTRIPDTVPEHSVWSIRVEAAGHGRWAIRHLGSCLNKQGEWETEPIPSYRTEEWLATCRWDLDDALEAAFDAEPGLIINGLSPAQALEEIEQRRTR